MQQPIEVATGATHCPTSTLNSTLQCSIGQPMPDIPLQMSWPIDAVQSGMEPVDVLDAAVQNSNNSATSRQAAAPAVDYGVLDLDVDPAAAATAAPAVDYGMLDLDLDQTAAAGTFLTADKTAPLPAPAAVAAGVAAIESQQQQQQEGDKCLPGADVTSMQVNDSWDLPSITTAAAVPTVSAAGSSMHGCSSMHQAPSSSQMLGPMAQPCNPPTQGFACSSKLKGFSTMQVEQLQQHDGGNDAAAAAAYGLGNSQPQIISNVSETRQQPELDHHQQQEEQQGCQPDTAAAAAATAAAAGGTSERPRHLKPDPQVPKKPPKPQPTHFMALQVSHSPKVVASVKAIQQKLVEADEQLKPCCLDPITAHITIMVLYLPEQEQVDAAEVAMAELGSVLAAKGLSAPIQLQLQGLSHFKHQVLYLDVAPGPARESLMNLGATVIDHFTVAAGGSLLVPGEDKPFIPHITVAKTSRVMGKHRRGKGRKGRLKIPESAWQDLAELDSGHVSIDEVQICSMQGRKTGQYYRVTHCLKLKEPTPAAASQPPARGAETRRSPIEAARNRFKRLVSACACGVLKRHKALNTNASREKH